MFYNSYVGPYQWQTKPRVGTRLRYNQPLLKGLVEAFFFNEWTGKNTSDMIGGFSAPFNGGVSWSSGDLLFDGSSGYIGPFGSTSTLSFIETTLVFTLVVRFRLASSTSSPSFLTTNGGSSGNKGIWFCSNVDTSQAPEVFITKGTSGTPVVDATGPAGSLADTSWHHLVVTGAGAGNTITFYLDNVQLITTYVNSYSSLSSGASTNAPIIGCYTASTTAADYFGGLLDHILIYNRTLSAAEVSQLYHNTFQVFEPQIDYTTLYQRILSGKISPSLARVLLGNASLTLGQTSILRR